MMRNIYIGILILFMVGCRTADSGISETIPPGEVTSSNTTTQFSAPGGPFSNEGCDGNGTKAYCLECGNTELSCKQVCVGYETCQWDTEGSCLLVGKCASGGPFGDIAPSSSVLDAGLADENGLTPDIAVAEQQKVNEYFQRSVIPQLKPCWNALSDQGEVVFRYSYEKDSYGNWQFQDVESIEATVLDETALTATECMRDAARGTSFADGEWYRGATEFTLNWRWPIPLQLDS